MSAKAKRGMALEGERFFARARDHGEVAPVLELADDAAPLIGIALDDEHLAIIHGERQRRRRFEAGDFHRAVFHVVTKVARGVPNLARALFAARVRGVGSRVP